ncbi:MAG: DeoR family transcriptional regulator [Anaerolineae bacterium]
MPNIFHRQQKILDLLKAQGSATIQELAEALHVSAMTIHRDLDKMRVAGLIKKTHGGVMLASSSSSQECAVCGKRVTERTGFVLHLKDSSQRRACCTHCGLILLGQSGEVTHALTADFLHGYMINAFQATYVLQSELVVCCGPSTFSFLSPVEAERFQKGFGGMVANFETAIRFFHAPHLTS